MVRCLVRSAHLSGYTRGTQRNQPSKEHFAGNALYAALYLYTLINNKYEHTMCMLLIFFSFWFFFFSLSTVVNLFII
jgi:hypothetical protein